MTGRVVVVGAGPVGLTAALLLARWRVPVTVLDRRAGRDPVGSKSICQQRDVLDIWASVGLGAKVAAEGVTWGTARTYHRDRELFATTFADRGRSPFPPFVNISQARVEELLDAAVAAQPLVEVRWGYEVTGLRQSADGVTVSCGDVRFAADYVLLCAGGHADGLRAELGVTFDGRAFDDRFLICDIRTDLPGWETERRFYFDPGWNPGRQVLIHPCPGSSYRIDWQVPPDYDPDADDLDARVRRIVGDRPYEVLWRSVYRFSSRLVDRMRVGRVLLAGDAAHVMAPFGARGLNSGVQDAENAAWKLAFMLRGLGGERLLESYHDERHAAARENLDVTGATMRFLVPPDEAAAAFRRDVLGRAASDPAARALVDSGRLAEPYWYVDSPLTTPDPGRPFAGRPAKGDVPAPAPGVLLPDVPMKDGRLRELVRDGFTVLADGRVAAPPGVRALPVTDLDPDGALAEALGARPGEAWLVRPDGHVAAVVPAADPDALATAARRATGW